MVEKINLCNYGPEDIEGIILLKPTGKIYQNQTGCVSCNHSEAEGEWIPVKIPEEIQRRTCRDGSCDSFTAEIFNRHFAEAGVPFRVTDGEEAWLHGFYNEEPAIATWWNCD